MLCLPMAPALPLKKGLRHVQLATRAEITVLARVEEGGGQPHTQSELFQCLRLANHSRKWPARAGVGCDSKACLTRPDWSLSTRPGRVPAWCGFAVAVRAESG